MHVQEHVQTPTLQAQTRCSQNHQFYRSQRLHTNASQKPDAVGLTRPKQEIDASEDLPDPVVFTIPRAAVPRIRAKYAIGTYSPLMIALKNCQCGLKILEENHEEDLE